MLSTILDTLFNGLLMGASGYVLFTLKPPEHPFAFAASAVGFCHGCTGIYSQIFETPGGSAEYAEGKCLSRAKMFTNCCLDLISVPLINMELYRSSQQTNALALGHGLFIIPLSFDLIFRVFAAEEAEDSSTAVLKDLTILGNIVSLMFYAANENNLAAGVMALSAFFAYYGSLAMENVLPGSGENVSLAGYSLFLGLMPAALRAGGQ